jgi:hypothetical protein
MDANKSQKLREAGYEVRPCCHFCEHGYFVPNPDALWGTCSILKYEHLKHSGPPRDASISCYGHCPQFKADAQRVRGGLVKFEEFFLGDRE